MIKVLGAETTTDEVLEGVNLSGKRILVTGVSAGLGIETARAPDTIGGRYCEDCHVAEIVEGEGIRGGIRGYALDAEHAKALWAKSDEMVGEKF
jgi:hypothetical protein